MISIEAELERVAAELAGQGYSLTSHDQLGIPFDANAAQQLHELTLACEGSQAALDAVAHIDTAEMTIVQDERCMELARSIISPSLDLIFVGDQFTPMTWKLFGLNRYNTGGKFGPHQDNVGATVVVFTLAGERQFETYVTSQPGLPDGTIFDQVEQGFLLAPGSIMILDKDKDPAHAVSSVLSPSLTAVADVQGIVRS